MKPFVKKLRIMKRLVSLLEEITEFTYTDDAGEEITVQYDLAGKIFRGLSVIPAHTAKDALSILEAPRPVFGDGAGEKGLKRKGPWTLLLQGWPEDDTYNPSDPAYLLEAACCQQLAKITAVDSEGMDKHPEVTSRFKGDILSLTIGQGVVRPPEDNVSRLAMFYLPLVVEIATDLEHPSE